MSHHFGDCGMIMHILKCIEVGVDKIHDFCNQQKIRFFYFNKILICMIFLISCVEGGHLTSSNFQF